MTIRWPRSPCFDKTWIPPNIETIAPLIRTTRSQPARDLIYGALRAAYKF